jgi:hypothetical protein
MGVPRYSAWSGPPNAGGASHEAVLPAEVLRGNPIGALQVPPKKSSGQLSTHTVSK